MQRDFAAVNISEGEDEFSCPLACREGRGEEELLCRLAPQLQKQAEQAVCGVALLINCPLDCLSSPAALLLPLLEHNPPPNRWEKDTVIATPEDKFVENTHTHKSPHHHSHFLQPIGS